MADNLVNDIVQQIVDEKPQKSKIIIKWLIRVSIFLVGVAFTYGQYKMGQLNKLGEIQKNMEALQIETKKNTEAINNLQINFDTELKNMKNEGYDWFLDYQKYTKNQFELIIDYGSTNKDLLKRMIEINAQEKSQDLKTKLEQSKIQPTIDPSIFAVSYVVSASRSDTIFFAKNANEEFLKKIKKKYKINKTTPSIYGENLIDITYQNY